MSEKETSYNAEYNNNAEDETITLDYVCEYYDIDKAEFDDVDFDEFVDYYGLTKNDVGDVMFLLDKYKELEYKVKIPNYSEYEVSTDVFLSDFKDKVSVVIIDNDIADGATLRSESTIIDFDLGYVFTGYGIDVVSEDDIYKETNDEMKDNILKCFDKYEIYNWEKQKFTDSESEAKEDGQPSQCALIIKLDDGTVYGTSYVKSGEERGSIDEFYSFVDEMAKLARE